MCFQIDFLASIHHLINRPSVWRKAFGRTERKVHSFDWRRGPLHHRVSILHFHDMSMLQSFVQKGSYCFQLRLAFRNAFAFPEQLKQTTFDEWPDIANAQVFLTGLKIKVTGNQILIVPDKSMSHQDAPCEDSELGKKLNMPCIRMSMHKYIALLLGAKEEEENGILASIYCSNNITCNYMIFGSFSII